MKTSAASLILFSILTTAVSATELGLISGPQDELGNQPEFVLLIDGDLDEAFTKQVLLLNYWWFEKDIVLNAAESRNLPVCKMNVQSSQMTAECECRTQHKAISHNRDEENSIARTILELEDVARSCSPPVPTI